MSADVTICIPAYKSAGFVGKAIESVLGQSYGDLKLLISVEPTDDGTEDVCRAYERDKRVTVRVNPERLGWVGNSNACLDWVDTPFMAFCFHDDWYAPDYVKETRAALLSDPGAASAFCQMQMHGERTDVMRLADIEGTAFERALFFLCTHQASVSLKAMTRMSGGPEQVRLRPIGPMGYQGNVIASLEFSLCGTTRIVDKVLYHKIVSDDTQTADWRRTGAEALAVLDAQARAAMLNIIAKADLNNAEKLTLSRVILARALLGGHDGPEALETLEEDALNSAALTALAQEGVVAEGAPAQDEAGLANAQLADLSARRARQYVHAKDAHGAMLYARHSLRMDPGNTDAQLAEATARLQQARTTPDEHLRAAMKSARVVTDADPSNARAWWVMAQVARRQGRPEPALRFARRARAGWSGQTDQIDRFIAALERSDA
ncbi:MAG: glycosyltransferase [Pseudomonadota bacterium]